MLTWQTVKQHNNIAFLSLFQFKTFFKCILVNFHSKYSFSHISVFCFCFFFSVIYRLLLFWRQINKSISINSIRSVSISHNISNATLARYINELDNANVDVESTADDLLLDFLGNISTPGAKPIFNVEQENAILFNTRDEPVHLKCANMNAGYFTCKNLESE